MDGVNQAVNRYSGSPVIETRVPQDKASRFAAAAPLPNPRTSYDISSWGSIKTMVSRKIEILFAGTERATVKDRHAHKDVQMDLVRVMVQIGQGSSPTRSLEALMVSLDNFEKRGGGNAMEAIEQALYRMDVEIKDAPDRFEKNLKFLDRVSSDKIRQGVNQIFDEGRSAGHDITPSWCPENKMQLLLQQIGQSARKQIHASFPELSGQLAAISNKQIGLLAEALDMPAPISAPVPAVPLAQTYSAQYRTLTEAMATELGDLGTKLKFGFSTGASEDNAAEKFAVLASKVGNLPPAEVRALVGASMNALAKGEHASAIDNPPQTAIVMLQSLSKDGGNFKSFEDALPDNASKHFLHLIQTLAQDQLAILALGDIGAVQIGSPMRAPGLTAAAGSSVDQVAYQALGQDLAAQLGALGTNLKLGFAGVPDEKGDVPGERSAAEKFNSLAAQLEDVPDAVVRPLVAAAMNAVAESSDAFTEGKPVTLKGLFEGLSTTAGNMNHFESLLNGGSSIRLMSLIKTEAAHQLGALSLDGIDDDNMAQVMQALSEPVNTDAHAAPIQYRSLSLSLATQLGELGAGLKHGFSLNGQEVEASKKLSQLARIFKELPKAEADILIAASINALATGSHPLTTGKLQHAKNVLEGLTKDSTRKQGMRGRLDGDSLDFLDRIAAEAQKHLPADTA